MPDRGLLELSEAHLGSFATEPIALTGSRWLQVTFEVDREAALASLPCEVSRPVPPYGRLFIASSAKGGLAILSVGGRYRMMPRNVIAIAVSEDMENAFGSGTVAGKVSLERTGPELVGRIELSEGTVTVTLPALYAIEPSMLRWDALVALGDRDGASSLGEITPAADMSQAFLSKGAAVTIDSSFSRESPWRRLRSLGMISACYAEGAFEFGAPQFDPA